MANRAEWIKDNMLNVEAPKAEEIRPLNEYEIRVRKSLAKLSIPHWYMNRTSQAPKIINPIPIEQRPSPWKSDTYKKNKPSTSLLARVASTITSAGNSASTSNTFTLSPRGCISDHDLLEYTAFGNITMKTKKRTIFGGTYPRSSASKRAKNIDIVLPKRPPLKLSIEDFRLPSVRRRFQFPELEDPVADCHLNTVPVTDLDELELEYAQRSVQTTDLDDPQTEYTMRSVRVTDLDDPNTEYTWRRVQVTDLDAPGPVNKMRSVQVTDLDEPENNFFFDHIDDLDIPQPGTLTRSVKVTNLDLLDDEYIDSLRKYNEVVAELQAERAGQVENSLSDAEYTEELNNTARTYTKENFIDNLNGTAKTYTKEDSACKLNDRTKTYTKEDSKDNEIRSFEFCTRDEFLDEFNDPESVISQEELSRIPDSRTINIRHNSKGKRLLPPKFNGFCCPARVRPELLNLTNEKRPLLVLDNGRVHHSSPFTSIYREIDRIEKQFCEECKSENARIRVIFMTPKSYHSQSTNENRLPPMSEDPAVDLSVPDPKVIGEIKLVVSRVKPLSGLHVAEADILDVPKSLSIEIIEELERKCKRRDPSYSKKGTRRFFKKLVNALENDMRENKAMAIEAIGARSKPVAKLPKNRSYESKTNSLSDTELPQNCSFKFRSDRVTDKELRKIRSSKLKSGSIRHAELQKNRSSQIKSDSVSHTELQKSRSSQIKSDSVSHTELQKSRSSQSKSDSVSHTELQKSRSSQIKSDSVSHTELQKSRSSQSKSDSVSHIESLKNRSSESKSDSVSHIESLKNRSSQFKSDSVSHIESLKSRSSESKSDSPSQPKPPRSNPPSEYKKPIGPVKYNSEKPKEKYTAGWVAKSNFGTSTPRGNRSGSKLSPCLSPISTITKEQLSFGSPGTWKGTYQHNVKSGIKKSNAVDSGYSEGATVSWRSMLSRSTLATERTTTFSDLNSTVSDFEYHLRSIPRGIVNDMKKKFSSQDQSTSHSKEIDRKIQRNEKKAN